MWENLLDPNSSKEIFDRVGVDAIKFPCSFKDKKYAVVFMNYLTKWSKVFATSDQTSLTIAELLAKNIVS